MLLLLLFAPDIVFAVRVGMISNANYITSNTDRIYSNMTCIQCTCAALAANAVGWNCLTNNNTCQLISNYSSNNGYLLLTINGSFFFQLFLPQLLPTVSDTTPTTTDISESPTISTNSAISSTLESE